MSTQRLIWAIVVMAAVTYLPRVVPIGVFRKKIKNRFLQSFLMYMLWRVGGNGISGRVHVNGVSCSAIAGTVVALALSYKNLGLMPLRWQASGRYLPVSIF